VRIYSHLERQLISYQVNAVLGAHNFPYLEERVSYCSIEQKMYVMRPLHRIYRGVPLVQETHFWCTNKDKTSGFG